MKATARRKWRQDERLANDGGRAYGRVRPY
jgi:hypothetical protein